MPSKEILKTFLNRTEGRNKKKQKMVNKKQNKTIVITKHARTV